MLETKSTSVTVITISSDKEGQRIDNFLFTKLKGVPNRMIYRLLRKGEVRVNKKRIKPKYKLLDGDKVRIPPIQIFHHKEKEIFQYLYKTERKLCDITLYEDDFILALNKPSGTAVHNGSGLSFSLIESLRMISTKSKFLELIHRLDRGTSGVLLLAKKRSAMRFLHKQLREKKIEKDYLALVQGLWKSNVTVIKAPLLKKFLKKGEKIMQVDKKGKPSETYFKIEEKFDFSTLIRCKPITGRTHQIRVHAQYAGHPIAFDNLYGNCEFDKKLKKTGLSRLFLHAKSLKFIHPNTGETMRIEAPMDKQLELCLKFLRS